MSKSVTVVLLLQLLLSSCVCAASWTSLFDEHVARERLVFASDEERSHRLIIFQQNLAQIERENAKSGRTSTSGVTRFAHLTYEEYADYASNKGVTEQQHQQQHRQEQGEGEIRRLATQTPASWDWSALGAMTPVKNQGTCGSCYNFAAVGAIESAYFIKYGVLPGLTPSTSTGFVGLSEEQYMVCGCLYTGAARCTQGGISEAVWLYAANNGGLASEASYPYQDPLQLPGGISYYDTVTCPSTLPPAVPGTQPDPSNPFTYVQATIADIMANVINQPLSVRISASCPLLQTYTGGVLSDTSCLSYNDPKVQHRLLLVGYGTDAASGLRYWKVKNSWGVNWGEQGYMRFAISPDVLFVLNGGSLSFPNLLPMKGTPTPAPSVSPPSPPLAGPYVNSAPLVTCGTPSQCFALPAYGNAVKLAAAQTLTQPDGTTVAATGTNVDMYLTTKTRNATIGYISFVQAGYTFITPVIIVPCSISGYVSACANPTVKTPYQQAVNAMAVDFLYTWATFAQGSSAIVTGYTVKNLALQVDTSFIPASLIADCKALCDLYNTAAVASRAQLQNWVCPSLGGECCGSPAWTGIQCQNQRVTQINLPSIALGVGASIPSTFGFGGSLNAVNWLDLSATQVGGSIPSSLGLMTALTSLQLQTNSLRASLPTSLGALTALAWFSAYNNLLTGQIPQSACAWPSALKLQLQGNAITCSPACLLSNPTYYNKITNVCTYAPPTPSSTPNPTPQVPPQSKAPTPLPTSLPTLLPTLLPSPSPTPSPSAAPSPVASAAPSTSPTAAATLSPSTLPTSTPSVLPSAAPTAQTTMQPTSLRPSPPPSSFPTAATTQKPSPAPSALPSALPSVLPSSLPSSLPSARPSSLSTALPSAPPSAVPSVLPSAPPSSLSTVLPSAPPSPQPTIVATAPPSLLPTLMPTLAQTSTQTSMQTLLTTASAFSLPSASPTVLPKTAIPSASPSMSMLPSSTRPSSQPTSVTTALPSLAPTLTPTSLKTQAPSSLSTNPPSAARTQSPTRASSPPPTVLPSVGHTSSAPSQSTSIAAPTFSPSPSPSPPPSGTIRTHSTTQTPSPPPSALLTVSPSQAHSLAPSSAAATTVSVSVSLTCSGITEADVTPLVRTELIASFASAASIPAAWVTKLIIAATAAGAERRLDSTTSALISLTFHVVPDTPTAAAALVAVTTGAGSAEFTNTFTQDARRDAGIAGLSVTNVSASTSSPPASPSSGASGGRRFSSTEIGAAATCAAVIAVVAVCCLVHYRRRYRRNAASKSNVDTIPAQDSGVQLSHALKSSRDYSIYARRSEFDVRNVQAASLQQGRPLSSAEGTWGVGSSGVLRLELGPAAVVNPLRQLSTADRPPEDGQHATGPRAEAMI